jgi:hypothetical protein
MSLLIPPSGTEIFETSSSQYWFADGLLYLISKKDHTPSTEEQGIAELVRFNEQLKGRKIAAVMDISQSRPATPEQRSRQGRELSRFFSAIAFIATNPMTRMLTNVYLGTTDLGMPVKLFSTSEEALKWIAPFRQDQPSAQTS